MPRRPAHKPAHQESHTRGFKLRRYRRVGNSARVNKKAKAHKNLLKAVMLAVLLLVSIFFILGLGFYKKITQNFASASSPNSYSIRDRDIYTLLYMSDDAYYLSFFDTRNKKIISYNIPLNLTLDVPGKYGVEEISKVQALGKLSNKDDEMLLVTRSVTKLFGYKVDKYIVSGHNMTLGMSDFYKDVKESNVSLSDAYYMYSFIKSLPSDSFIKKDFTFDYASNTDLIDSDIKDLTFDSKVALEKKSIAVLNGADMPGLANYASRIIVNEGGRVVSTGNSQIPYSETVLVVDDPESETVTEMVHSFGIKKVLRKSQSEINENEVDRADIVLILGLDMKDVL